MLGVPEEHNRNWIAVMMWAMGKEIGYKMRVVARAKLI